MYFFLTNVDGGGSATLGSKMVVLALNVNDTASILALSPEMHQKPCFSLSASLLAVSNLHNPTHIDPHAIWLSIMRDLQREIAWKKGNGARRKYFFVPFCIHVLFLFLSFLERMSFFRFFLSCLQFWLGTSKQVQTTLCKKHGLS